MNALEELLQNDLNHLVDRIAAMVPSGMVSDCARHRPELTGRLGEAEMRLSTVRQDLLRHYVAWRQAIQECGDLWALVDRAGDTAPTPDERQAA